MVEAVPTKLPHYVLAAYPALAILAALFVLDPRPVQISLADAARWIAIVQFVVGAVLLTAVVILAPRYFGEGDVGWPVDGRGGVARVPGAGGAGAGDRCASRCWAVVLSLCWPCWCSCPTLTAGVGPRLDQLWVTERLKPLVEAASQPGDPPPALAGYQEPSLVFALGKDVVLADGAGAAEAGAKSGGLALVEDARAGRFPGAAGGIAGRRQAGGRAFRASIIRAAARCM